MNTADDYTAYIRSTTDGNGKAACLLQGVQR